MDFSNLFLVLSFVMIFGVLRTVFGANVTGNSSIFDDRININLNQGHAHAYNPDGSFSGSDAFSSGFQAGILYPGQRYQPLASKTTANSNSFAHGRRPPSTYANTGVNAGPYGIKGNVNSGYSGGQGQAWSKSQSQQFAIPLGFGGAVVLSNLHPVNNGTKTNETVTAPAQNGDKGVESGNNKTANRLTFN